MPLAARWRASASCTPITSLPAVITARGSIVSRITGAPRSPPVTPSTSRPTMSCRFNSFKLGAPLPAWDKRCRRPGVRTSEHHPEGGTVRGFHFGILLRGEASSGHAVDGRWLGAASRGPSSRVRAPNVSLVKVNRNSVPVAPARVCQDCARTNRHHSTSTVGQVRRGPRSAWNSDVWRPVAPDSLGRVENLKSAARGAVKLHRVGSKYCPDRWVTITDLSLPAGLVLDAFRCRSPLCPVLTRPALNAIALIITVQAIGRDR